MSEIHLILFKDTGI